MTKTKQKESTQKVLAHDFRVNATTFRENYIREEFGPEVLGFLHERLELSNSSNLVLATSSRFNILNQIGLFENMVNLRRINDIRYLNKFFEAVNARLPIDGTFIGCVETKDLRKERILRKYPAVLNHVYYCLDFMLKRVFPKLPVTKKIYFFLTRGNNRVISRSETLGRLIACGFKIEEEHNLAGNLYFVTRKVKAPLFPEDPTYGLLIKLKRIGKHGKPIRVYKLRTMHPFAEYLQDYVYRSNQLDKSGKFSDDFRVATIGKFLRKFWLDELPMFINFFKGDLKFVGVRPISPHYFNLYDEDLKKLRVKHKPGLFPPYYADLPETLEEIMASERRYLEQYEKHPLVTDVKYFRKIFCNIVFRKARSS
ncbi:sugar transferase [Tangfeifania diversioriginum]|uniref:Sugar transferase n=1 Tax=Tangfeifania diversioriginum TaxID=1168035 RepID=A0A1M6NM96_9BACT|nr:sugar transferase [Tangfeifania diversioriginum]SHJ96840.1 sugar transferase [Tangfeifania diversioriginum]